MIVVDSTVWIDFFNGRSTDKSIILEKVMQYDRIILLDLIKIEGSTNFRVEKLQLA